MAGGYNTGQATVATTATVIAPARPGRKTITIANSGTTDVYIGGAAVTTSTGFLLHTGTKGAGFTFGTEGPVYGIVGSGTQVVSYLETL